MYRDISLACLALLLVIRTAGIAAGGDTSTPLHLTEPAPDSVGLYGKYELTFQLDRVIENPFDSDEIDVRCVFVAPSGRESRVTAFVYDRKAGIWKLRHAPRELGRYQGTIIARGKDWQEELSLLPFDVTESTSKGFVVCTAEKPGRLQFETGEMFLPVSMVLWGNFLSANAAELSQLQSGRINHIRLISNESCFGGAYHIERTGFPLGEYDLDRAKNLDRLFERLDALDMYVTFNFLLNTDFRVTDPWPGFGANPYNATHGGPCEVPSDIFTNLDARRLFKQRLRYTLARWGYSTRLCLWELWAEADVSEGFDRHVESARDWHQEMADYLRATDPYQHPVTSSLSLRSMSTAFAGSGIFEVASMDVVATELYNDRDMGKAVHNDALHVINKYRKPQLCIELGLAHGMFSDDRDVNGIHVHAALWSSVMSGSSMTPCFWHWSKILELQLLPHFAAIAQYLAGENFIGLHPMEVETLRYSTLPREPVFGDFELPTPDEEVAWGPPLAGAVQEADGAHVIRIPNNGQPLEARIPRILPPNRPVAFEVEYAADGEFVFAGWWLPDTGIAKVRARLDDKEVLHEDLPGVGWEGRLSSPYQTHLGVPYSLPVPKGQHRILLENTGDAWVTMSVDLCNYQRPDRPNVRVYGLGNPTHAYLWITNRDNTWWRNRMGKMPRNACNVRAAISGFQPGNYDVEWWDTYAGVVSGRESVVADTSGTLELNIPEITLDVACKIRPAAQ